MRIISACFLNSTVYPFSISHVGDTAVLTTIVLGTCVSVQGIFVKRLANGLVTVRVGEQFYTGRPVAPAVAA